MEIEHAGQHILYDASLATQVEQGLDACRLLQWFDETYWRARGKLKGEARGRGSAFFFEHQDCEYVLRHYRRGGMVAGLVEDRYIWTGLGNSRPWREWHLLAAAHERGLPAPKPFAARLIKSGMFYTADLITHRIAAGVSLAQQLTAGRQEQAVWRKIGRVIRRFHDAGIEHADLNAHNILLAGDDAFLVDFDRGRMHAGVFSKRIRNWRRRNLQRLLRSLNKLGGQKETFHFTSGDWHYLLEGYRAA